MKIQKYKKLKDNRYEVITDNKKVILYDDVLLKHSLLLKKELSAKELDKIQGDNDKLKSYYKALNYLNIKMRSQKEIENHLKKLEFSPSVIIDTINKLKKDNLINDSQYLKSYINDQILLSANGPFLIKNKLLQMNISETDIDNYIDSIELSVWEDKIIKIIQKKGQLKTKDSLNVYKQKLSRYLFNLGYSHDLIEKHICNINFNDDEALKKEITKLKAKYFKKYDESKANYYIKQKLLSKGYTHDKINEFLT